MGWDISQGSSAPRPMAVTGSNPQLTSRSIFNPWWYTSVSKVMRCSSSVTISEA